MRKQLIKSLVLGTLVAGAFLISGCFTGSDESSSRKDATLSIRMGVQDVDKGGALHKGSAITFSKLVVTLVSNATVPDTLRDTIVAADTAGSIFTSVATDSQTVSKSYNIKPLRNWTITVKTLDVNDSVIHSGTVSANNILVGETRAVTLNLTSKYVMYVAQFALPDSLRASGTSQAQVLNINRFMMVVDGDTVVDSTKDAGYFAAAPTVHSIEFDYVKVDTTHTLELYIFGDVPGWPSDKPLFGDTITVAPSNKDTTYTPTLPWTGPGSPEDPNYDPNNPGGASSDLTINIGKVGTVYFVPEIPGIQFPKRGGK